MKIISGPVSPLRDFMFKRSRKCYTTYVPRHLVSEISVAAKWRNVSSNKHRWLLVTTGVQSGQLAFKTGGSEPLRSVLYTRRIRGIRSGNRGDHKIDPPHPILLPEYVTSNHCRPSHTCRHIFKQDQQNNFEIVISLGSQSVSRHGPTEISTSISVAKQDILSVRHSNTDLMKNNAKSNFWTIL